jgi:hypothetical protein
MDLFDRGAAFQCGKSLLDEGLIDQGHELLGDVASEAESAAPEKDEGDVGGLVLHRSNYTPARGKEKETC